MMCVHNFLQSAWSIITIADQNASESRNTGTHDIENCWWFWMTHTHTMQALKWSTRFIVK